MTAITFDTLAYSKKMKAVGFTEQQADAQAEAMSEILDEKLATKQDLEIKISQLKEDLIKFMAIFCGLTVSFLTFVMAAFKFFH
jgi:hypothetical protein